VKPVALRAKLAIVFAGALAVLLIGFGVTAYHLLKNQLDAAATADLDELTDGLHGYLHIDDGVPTLVYDRAEPAEAAFIETATRFYQVYDATTGALLVQSPAMEPLALEFTPQEVQAYRDRSGTRDIQTDQGRLRFSNTIVHAPSGGIYLLQVGVLLRSMDRALNQFLRLLVWSIPVCVIIAAVVGRWMAGRSLAPLGRLAAAAGAISVTELHQRLPVRGGAGEHDELDRVAVAFNETLSRLERSVAEMRQFSAALAHELRAPLAALRAEIETTLSHATTPDEYQRGLVSQLEELDRLGRLVTHLLTLARAEAGEIRLAREPVDLGALAASLVSQLDAVADAKHVALTADVTPDVIVTGDAGWIERLVLNLLDNAIKFTPEGGRVAVTVTVRDGAATLTVSDTGIGIAGADLAHVFERFYRADSARSPQTEGVGLGLTLAKWIADKHGATIAAASTEGRGSALTVSFPVTSRP
jgi:heavy metal sensor kinase